MQLWEISWDISLANHNVPACYLFHSIPMGAHPNWTWGSCETGALVQDLPLEVPQLGIAELGESSISSLLFDYGSW